MPAAPELLTAVLRQPPAAAWGGVASWLWDAFSAPLPATGADREVVTRDRGTTELDNVLGGSAWDLWSSFAAETPRASQAIVDFWTAAQGGKAVLILDGLSLREAPWLLQEAVRRGYSVCRAEARAAELPPDTTPFAQSLGFGQRSALDNNGAGNSHRLPGAYTEACNLPWMECVGRVSSQPSVVFWHHWPDERMHALDGPGDMLRKLSQETQAILTSDAFWAFVERLTTGRRLAITADHGYAATGLFHDLTDKGQIAHMKEIYKSGRSAPGGDSVGPWVPPIELTLTTDFGLTRFVLGRRKWKSAAGYPTLQHGGLSLLEVFVPFIELTR